MVFQAKRKTAVEEEEEESERDSLASSEDDEDEEEDLAGSEENEDNVQGSVDEDGDEVEDDEDDEGDDDEEFDEDEDEPEDSDDEDLSRYTPSSSARAGPSRQPRLVVPSKSISQADSFGARLSSARPSAQSKSKSASAGVGGGLGADDGVLAMRRGADGGMEMSFIPKGTKDRRPGSGAGGAGSDEDEDGGGGARGGKRGPKVEKFGAGMEKGGEAQKAEWERGGRKERRHPGRSASKNVFRKR